MIETERLIIRPFTLKDAHDVYECCNDYEVVKTTLGMPWPYTEDMAKGWINNQKQRASEGSSYELAICFKDNPDKVIGCVSLLNIDKNAQRGEIGYWVGRKYWKQGIATEATKGMIEFAFKKIKLHSVIARYFEINPASARVMQKCGMTYVGRFRQHEIRFDEYMNVGYYEMIETDLTNQ